MDIFLLNYIEEVEILSNNEEEIKLYIPSNVKTRLEFFSGYGVKELISTIIVFAILLPVSITVYLIKKELLIPIIIEFIGIAGTVLATAKDKNNLCVVDQIKYMIEFSKEQKEFKYKYFDKWRNKNV